MMLAMAAGEWLRMRPHGLKDEASWLVVPWWKKHEPSEVYVVAAAGGSEFTDIGR